MIIEVNNLVKRYKEQIALDHFHISVEEGEILGLLGPNGSGKTTAIYCMLSLLNYDKGDIRIFDQPMTPDAYEIKRHIGIIPQNIAVFYELNVQENIDYFCGLYIKDKKERKRFVDDAIAFVNLQEFRKYRPGKLSGGLLRRLNIACGIAHKPTLIFMDEPTVAVDPQSRNAILEGIKKLNQEGATIVYTSHYMEEVEMLCSRIIIMDNGLTIATGTCEELKASIAMKEKVDVEMVSLQESEIQEIQAMEHVYMAQYQNNSLQVKFTKGTHNLKDLLEYFHQHNIQYGKVYSQMPTLNDVFLEITGKQLRDTR